MNKTKLKKEWDKIRVEILRNKPKSSCPYPPEIVFLRELLLAAQIILEKISKGENIKFNTETYKKIINFYYKHLKKIAERNDSDYFEEE